MKAKLVIKSKQNEIILIDLWIGLQGQIQSHMDTKTGHISDLKQKYSELDEAMTNLKQKVGM